jgi:hypothetical protein
VWCKCTVHSYKTVRGVVRKHTLGGRQPALQNNPVTLKRPSNWMQISVCSISLYVIWKQKGISLVYNIAMAYSSKYYTSEYALTRARNGLSRDIAFAAAPFAWSARWSGDGRSNCFDIVVSNVLEVESESLVSRTKRFTTCLSRTKCLVLPTLTTSLP